MKRKKANTNRNLKKESKKINNILFIVFLGVILTLISFFIDSVFIKFISSIRFDVLNGIFSALTYLGNFEIFLMIALIITVFFLIHKKPFIAFWFSIIGSVLFGILVKYVIGRTRPFEDSIISNLVPAALSSFPSAHAIAAFSVLPFLNKAFPKSKIIFWSLAILVAFSRIYLGVHYLSDVIAGAFIGYGVAYLFLYLGKKYQWK